jgi:hypothetical protein
MKHAATPFVAVAPLALLGTLVALAALQDSRPPAASAPGASAARVDVYEFTTRRQPKIEGVTLYGSEGVEIKLAVEVPGASLLAIDEDATVLRGWADDQGTNLAPSDEDSFFHWAQMDTRWDEEERMDVATLTVRTERLPVAGAERVKLDATLVFVDAADLTTKDVTTPIAKGSKFELAGVAAEITEVTAVEDSDEWAVQVAITTKKPLAALQGLVFKDAEGAEIPSDDYGSSSMSMFGSKSYTYYYMLGRAVDSATLSASYYARMGTVEVPLALDLGVGL